MPLSHAAIGIVIVLLQWLLFGRLDIWGARPNVVLLYIAWIGLRHGRETGASVGFTAGLLLDAVYATWGLHMLTGTLTGFLLGLFPANERETLLILPQQAFIGGLAIALLHNGLMVALLALDAGTRNVYMISTLWLGSALYTAVLAMIASLFSTR